MIDKEILDAVIPVPTLEEAKDEKVAELKEEGFVVTNFHSGGVFYTLLMVELRIKIELLQLARRILNNMVWRPGLPLFYIPDSSTAFQTIHGAVSSFVAFGPMWSARVTCLPRRSRHRAEKTPATSSSRSPAHSRRLRSSITSATIPSTRGSPLTSRRSPGLRAASRNT